MILSERFFNDRQIRCLGTEAFEKIKKSKVLVVGMSGLGIEVSKNLICFGFEKVYLCDDSPVRMDDLSSTFYLSESDVGNNRVMSCIEKLKKINQNVNVMMVKRSDALSKTFLETIDLVCFTDDPIFSLTEINSLCRECRTKFVVCNIIGLFSVLFNDFGANHCSTNPNGSSEFDEIVTGITNSNPALVSISIGGPFNQPSPLNDILNEEKIVFSKVKGMTKLNEIGPIKISVINEKIIEEGSEGGEEEEEGEGKTTTSKKKYDFKINVDTTNFPKYEGGGYLSNVLPISKYEFLTLEESIENPKFSKTTTIKTKTNEEEKRSGIYFAIWSAFYEFTNSNNEKKRENPFLKPKLYDDEEDVKEILKIVRKNTKYVFDSDDDLKNVEELVRKFSFTCTSKLSSVAVKMGGFASFEIVKAVVGKFTPVHQWLFGEENLALPCPIPTSSTKTKSSTPPPPLRLSGMIDLFGEETLDHVGSKKILVIGTDELWCEVVKTLSSMGFGRKSCDGAIYVVSEENNNDVIERVDLPTNTMFNSEEMIGTKKCETLSSLIQDQYSDLNIQPFSANFLDNKSNNNTPHLIKTTRFWNEGVDYVVLCNCDNLQSVSFFREQCIYFSKPMIVLYDQGDFGYTRTSIPHLTKIEDLNTREHLNDLEKHIHMLQRRKTRKSRRGGYHHLFIHFPVYFETCIYWVSNNLFKDMFMGEEEFDFDGQTNNIYSHEKIFGEYFKNPKLYKKKITDELLKICGCSNNSSSSSSEEEEEQGGNNNNQNLVLYGNLRRIIWKMLNLFLVEKVPRSYEDCVRWACRKFHFFFNSVIHQILESFPPEKYLNYKYNVGSVAWRGYRPRYRNIPIPLSFKEENISSWCFDFINSSSLIRSQLFNNITKKGGDDVDNNIIEGIFSQGFKEEETMEEKIGMVMENFNDVFSSLFDINYSNHHANLFGDKEENDRSITKEALIDSISEIKELIELIPDITFKQRKNDDDNDEEECEGEVEEDEEEEEKVVVPERINDEKDIITYNPIKLSEESLGIIENILVDRKTGRINEMILDFFSSAANMRAISYGIPTKNDKFEMYDMASREFTLPFLSSTVSAVSGLGCSELLNMILIKKKSNSQILLSPSNNSTTIIIDSYRNHYIDLTFGNRMTSVPPELVEKKTYLDQSVDNVTYTDWDFFELDFKRDITLNELIKFMKKEHGLHIECINVATLMLYADFLYPDNEEETLMEEKIGDLVMKENNLPYSKIQDGTDWIVLTILYGDIINDNFPDDEGIEVEAPNIKYKFRNFD